jgi:hypothetical protein
VALLDPQNKLQAITWDTRLQVHKLARIVPQLDLVVRSARRTCQEQQELYGIGRTYNLSSSPVTYARGCQSWHVSGRAVDLDLRAAGTNQDAGICANYAVLGEIWEQLGGRWGGRFGGFGACGDAGHFEYHPGLEISDVCPDPNACEQTAAVVDAQTITPWRYRLPWLPLAAGSALGAGVAWGLGYLSTPASGRSPRA